MADVSMGELLVRSVISLAVVLGIVFGAYAVLRRRMNGGGSFRPGTRLTGAMRALTTPGRSTTPAASTSASAPARSTRQNRNGLRVLGRATVGRSAQVTAVQFGDRVLLVGANDQGTPALLAEVDGREWEHLTAPTRELAIPTTTLGDLEAATTGMPTGVPVSTAEPVSAVHQRLDAAPRNLLDALREATTRRA